MEDDMPIESGWVTKAIETAQTKVEGHNFDIRKHVVDYDDVMNTQRDVIYKERQKILEGADLKANVLEHGARGDRRRSSTPNTPDDDAEAVGPRDAARRGQRHRQAVRRVHARGADDDDAGRRSSKRSSQFAEDAYEDKEEEIGADVMRALERLVMLRTIDSLWVEHLTAMDEMRQGIGLQAYGQTDPLVAYKREAHDMWDQLLGNIRNQITRAIYHVELATQPRAAAARRDRGIAARRRRRSSTNGNGAAAAPPLSLTNNERAQRAVAAAAGVKAPPKNLRTNQPDDGGGGGRTVVAAQKVGRNDPCSVRQRQEVQEVPRDGVAAGEWRRESRHER